MSRCEVPRRRSPVVGRMGGSENSRAGPQIVSAPGTRTLLHPPTRGYVRLGAVKFGSEW